MTITWGLIRGLAATAALTALATGVPAAASPASAARPAAGTAPACAQSLLTWFAPTGDGFAGGASYVVEFSNIGTSGTTCTVTGFPTVTLTENGHPVGPKAVDSGPAPVTVTLRPGQTAHVALTIHDAGNFCKPVPTNGLSVQPPGKTHRWDFPLAAFGACPGKPTMDVDAINPHTGVPFYTFR